MNPRKTIVRILAAFALAVSVAAAAAAPVAKANAQSADLATSIMQQGVPTTGGGFAYHITVHNNGPASASNVVISDATPSYPWPAHPTTFYCVGSGTAWCGPLDPGVSCTTPKVGSTGTVSCTTASLSAGASMTITMGVVLGFYMHNQLVCDSATASSSTFDPDTTNNTATICARMN